MNALFAARQERRSSARNQFVAPIQYENGANGIFYPAKMLNYSSIGMYFETAIIHRPGDEIYIDCDDLPYAENLEGHRAKVRWCQKIAGRDGHGQYGVGVEYFEKVP